MLSACEGAFTAPPSPTPPGRSVYNPFSPSSTSTPFPKPPPAQARSSSTCPCPYCPCWPSCPSHRPGQLPQTTLLGPNYQVLQSLESEAPGGYRFPECTQEHSALSTQRPSSRSCPSGSRATRQKDQPCRHHYSSHNHRSPGGDRQLRASSRTLKELVLCLSLTAMHWERGGRLLISILFAEEMEARVLFKFLQ